MQQNNYEKMFYSATTRNKNKLYRTKHASNGNEILTKCWRPNDERTVKFSGHFMYLVNQEKSIKQLLLAQRNKSPG